MFDIDAHLGVHADALKLRSQRAELLARNLANADTPGFQARDFDFRSALSAARGDGGSVKLAATSSGHLRAGGMTAGSTAMAEPELLYRTPIAPSVDGNTVDIQLEQTAFAENTVKYQVTLQFVNSKIRGLMTAFTGQ